MPTLAQRRKSFALSSVSGLLLVGLILILVNVLANWVFVRFDLTSSGSYSLAQPSKKLVRNLQEPVIIKAYFSSNLPSAYTFVPRYVRDLLTEYRSASKGKLKFEFVATYPPKDFEQRALEAGIVPVNIEQVGSDQMAVQRSFLGLVIFYRDKSEVLPVVRDIRTLEYDITSRIARMSNRTKRVIALANGHSEIDLTRVKSTLADDLKQLYEIKPVNLAVSSTGAVQADALFVVGPRQKFDEKALWAVDQAIMHGIPTAFFVDAKSFSPGQFIVSPQDTGLAPLLTHYGFVLGDRLVYDRQSETVQMAQNFGNIQIPIAVRYPFIPLVTGFDRKMALFRGIEAVAMPFPVSVEKGNPPAGVQITPLLLSSVESYLAPPQLYSVAPTQLPRPQPGEAHGPFALAALGEGTFLSYFQGRSSPFSNAALVGSSPRTSIVVVGTSKFVDPALPPFQGAEPLLSNLMAYLSKDDVLIGIRSKGDVLRPLKPLSDGVRQLVKLIALFGGPLIVVGLGVWRWRTRRAWREIIQSAFAAASPS